MYFYWNLLNIDMSRQQKVGLAAHSAAGQSWFGKEANLGLCAFKASANTILLLCQQEHVCPKEACSLVDMRAQFAFDRHDTLFAIAQSLAR